MITIGATAVEELAQRLAAQAGVLWVELGNHPGYQKQIWREKARELLGDYGLPANAPRRIS